MKRRKVFIIQCEHVFEAVRFAHCQNQILIDATLGAIPSLCTAKGQHIGGDH